MRGGKADCRVCNVQMMNGVVGWSSYLHGVIVVKVVEDQTSGAFLGLFFSRVGVVIFAKSLVWNVIVGCGGGVLVLRRQITFLFLPMQVVGSHDEKVWPSRTKCYAAWWELKCQRCNRGEESHVGWKGCRAF